MRLVVHRFIFTLALVGASFFSYAQLPTNSIPFTDQQLMQLFGVGTENMVKPSQLEARAIVLGFTPTQLPKLKKRLEQMRAGASLLGAKDGQFNTDAYEPRRYTGVDSRSYAKNVERLFQRKHPDRFWV